MTQDDAADYGTTAPTIREDAPPRPIATLRARVDALGHGTLSVNGEDLTDVTYGLDLSSRASEPTKAAIHLRAGAEIDFEGDAEVTIVQHYAEADPKEIAGWIARVDPKALEEAALNRADLRGDQRHGLTSAILTQLVEWASGRV